VCRESRVESKVTGWVAVWHAVSVLRQVMVEK
jgi:hypothetical protein